MSILFADARSSTPPQGRSPAGLCLSVGAHAVVVALIAVTIGAPTPPLTAPTRSLRVFLPATLPAVPVVAPRLPVPPPPPTPARVLAKAEVPKPLPVAPVVAKRIEPPPEPPPVLAVPVVERSLEKPEPPRPVETGLFDRTNSARPNRAEAPVTSGGFGSATAVPREAATGAVVTGAFNSGPSAPRAALAFGDVQTSGFDRRPSAPARSSPAPAPPTGRPVEIVFKPTPEYTDEARLARIEGTVSLELEFTAVGDVRVLRVLRGLGYGLDEAARRAALRIRFKPAQSDVGPIDSRATVHITFRLS